jgi:DNA-binding MarR family transcriptional regulator
MHSVIFGIKKAYHGTLRLLRYRIRIFHAKLTPARFDMMYALFGNREVKLVIRQKRMCEILGVTKPTVSRMSRSLEALGLVTRTRSLIDRRNVVIELTKAGYRLIKEAHAFFVKRGWADLAVCTALGHDEARTIDGNRWADAVYVYKEMDTLEAILDRIRHEYRDFATLQYVRWRPPEARPAAA